jgi:hypothetical protein
MFDTFKKTATEPVEGSAAAKETASLQAKMQGE